MNVLIIVHKYIDILYNKLVLAHCLDWLSDKAFLSVSYRVHLGKKLHLNNPRSLTEKIQWLKLYDRNPLYTRLVNKYEVKEWAKEIIGHDISIPTLGVWNKAEDIDFQYFLHVLF